MTRILEYLRQHAIALVALTFSIMALAGAGYAAISLPKNSVGSRQLRNGAVTPSKLDHKLIGGSIRAWAYIDDNGDLKASSGHATINVARPPGQPPLIGSIKWRGKFPRSGYACVPLIVGDGNVQSGQAPPTAALTANYDGRGLVVMNVLGEGVYVALVC